MTIPISASWRVKADALEQMMPVKVLGFDGACLDVERPNGTPFKTLPLRGWPFQIIAEICVKNCYNVPLREWAKMEKGEDLAQIIRVLSARDK